MALTDVGEIEVSVYGRDWLFRPSLSAISSLGTPEEIVQIFADLHATPSPTGNGYLDGILLRNFKRKQFRVAVTMLWACSTDDITSLVGGYKPSAKGLRYQVGFMPMHDMVVVASSLAQHGIVGKVKKGEREKKGDAEYSKGFNASEYVSMAIAHLGMTEREAWSMTMTGLLSAMRAKYPPKMQDGADAPSEEQHDITMSWLDKVNAARSIH